MASATDELPCHHKAPCACACPYRPLESVNYFNGVIRAPNRVTALYIQQNLNIMANDLIFVSAAFRELLISLPDVVRVHEPVRVSCHNPQGWVIFGKHDQDVTAVVLSDCAKRLARLNIINEPNKPYGFTSNHPRAEQAFENGWQTIQENQVALANCFVDLKCKCGRQFLCSFLGNFPVELWDASDDELLPELLGDSSRLSAGWKDCTR